MKLKYITTIILYITALFIGGYSLYFLILIYTFMYKDQLKKYLNKHTFKNALFWGFSGGLATLLLQGFWGFIQRFLLHLSIASIHTNHLVSQAQTGLKTIILICVICPILEEIIFRKIVFEAFKKKFGIITASIISAFLFSLIHFDFRNLIIYMLIGLAFSVIYTKTKSLSNSMAAHIFMNSIVLFILM